MTDRDDFTLFPRNFPCMDCRGQEFIWVFDHKKEWVNFCLTEMKHATGFFLYWQNYLVRKIK